jgi:hypothetical protein
MVQLQPDNSCGIIPIGVNSGMTKLKYTFKTDMLFKMLFVKYPDLLKKLVAELLEITLDSIEEFDVRNPEIPPDMIGDKSCLLDICMTVNGQRVDLEVQVSNEGNYPERAMFNWAREYSTALPDGGEQQFLVYYHEPHEQTQTEEKILPRINTNRTNSTNK